MRHVKQLAVMTALSAVVMLANSMMAYADTGLHDHILSDCTNSSDATEVFACFHEHQNQRVERFGNIAMEFGDVLEMQIQRVATNGVTDEQAETYRERAALSLRQQSEIAHQFLSSPDEVPDHNFGTAEIPMLARHAIIISYRQATTANSLAMQFCASNVEACLNSGYAERIVTVHGNVLEHGAHLRDEIMRLTNELAEMLNQ